MVDVTKKSNVESEFQKRFFFTAWGRNKKYMHETALAVITVWM